MAITTALGELEASQGNLDAARAVLQEGLERLSTVGSTSRTPASNRWVGPGRKASGWEEEESEGPADILLAWAKLEEQVGGGGGY